MNRIRGPPHIRGGVTGEHVVSLLNIFFTTSRNNKRSKNHQLGDFLVFWLDKANKVRDDIYMKNSRIPRFLIAAALIFGLTSPPHPSARAEVTVAKKATPAELAIESERELCKEVHEKVCAPMRALNDGLCHMFPGPVLDPVWEGNKMSCRDATNNNKIEIAVLRMAPPACNTRNLGGCGAPTD